MKTYCGSTAGSLLEPMLWDAQQSIWIISPWISPYYAEKLISFVQKGIEVRIVTSNDQYNLKTVEILRAYENHRLFLLVIDKNKVGFIHSKIYIVDKKQAISGSANLTNSGLNYNVESLNIAKNPNEVQQLEIDFMRLWMDFENKQMSKEDISNIKNYHIKDALPLAINYGEINNPNIIKKRLTYYPYYFFEYSFRTSIGKSPPVLFENRGAILIDAKNRTIVNHNKIINDVQRKPIENCYIKTNNEFTVTKTKPIIRNFQEAKQLAYDYIIKQNTRKYKQHYGDKTYEKVFVPYERIIRLIKAEFINVPLWYLDFQDEDGTKREELILASSNEKWAEYLICPKCKTKVSMDDAKSCKTCGKKLCSECINTKGLVFRKNYCDTCFTEIKNK